MVELCGNLRKMAVTLKSNDSKPVAYNLVLNENGDDKVEGLNQYIGQSINLRYSGTIHCVNCGRKSNKSFNQGHCYPCFKSLARCDQCIVSPEKCHYHLGTCREPSWADDFCMQDHYVYLANSSGLKVGITRGTQIPTRWIDQGAIQALPIYRVSNRLLSGKVEVVFKSYTADKTNWRTMLKGSPDKVDLHAEAKRLNQAVKAQVDQLQTEHGLQSITSCEAEVIDINYPVDSYPEKITSLNFDKTPELSGVLMGIKGQYLLLDTGVLNLRKFAGYHVAVNI